MNERRLTRACGMVTGLALLAGTAKADVVFNMTVMTNGALPVGPAPYARATFKTTAANTVQLTMENLGFASGMAITGWYFNVNLSAGDIAGMTFLHIGGQTVNGVSWGPDFSHGVDASSKAGLFDIVFDFPPPGNFFGAGEVSVWTITGNGLTEASFNAVSALEAGKGGWGSAARIQSYVNVLGESSASGTLGDGQIPQSVPEPFTLALLGGAAALGYRRVRSRKPA